MIYQKDDDINVIVYNKGTIDAMIYTDAININKDINKKYGFINHYFQL